MDFIRQQMADLPLAYDSQIGVECLRRSAADPNVLDDFPVPWAGLELFVPYTDFGEYAFGVDYITYSCDCMVRNIPFTRDKYDPIVGISFKCAVRVTRCTPLRGYFQRLMNAHKGISKCIDSDATVNAQMISKHNNRSVVYLALIGEYENRELLKVGQTSNIERRVEEHLRTFPKFKLLYVCETMNPITVESIFKRQHNDKRVNLYLGNRLQTELFCASYGVEQYIESIKQIKDYVYMNDPNILEFKQSLIDELTCSMQSLKV